MTTDFKVSVGLYAWSKDLEASSDVRQREAPAFAMLLGWLEKFTSAHGLRPGRETCTRFWKESVMTRTREAWQIDQWGAALRWYLRWLEHQQAKGGEVRSLPERGCGMRFSGLGRGGDWLRGRGRRMAAGLRRSPCGQVTRG